MAIHIIHFQLFSGMLFPSKSKYLYYAKVNLIYYPNDCLSNAFILMFIEFISFKMNSSNSIK